MSAFMCSDKHINAILTFADKAKYSVTYSWKGVRRTLKGREELQRAALVLQAANASSVNYRYVHNTAAQSDADSIVYRAEPRLDAVTLIKQCHCLAYQSCELDSWDESEACAILEAIKNAAHRELPGYDDAPWGI